MFSLQILANQLSNPIPISRGRLCWPHYLLPLPPWIFRPSDGSEMALNKTREGFANLEFVQIFK